METEMDMKEILSGSMARGGSDIFLLPGAPISMKINGEVTPLFPGAETPDDTERIAKEIYSTSGRDMERLYRTGDDDFSFSLRGVGRFRCNAYRQRNSLAMVLRVVSFSLPDAQRMQIPEQVMRLADVPKGLVLITGPAGSGKSTTLACLIDRINQRYADHIITIEDPIEFIHPHKKSIVSQREIEHDTENYASALRAALRQAPDVILLGEMRDYETIQTALTAAETGQLVLSTLHTVGAAKTIDRIIDVFSPNQQQQIRMQLSLVLRAVVSQQLIPTVSGGMAPAFEIMLANTAIRSMIRESKIPQMDNVLRSEGEAGMQTMDSDLMRLYRKGEISRENCYLYASNQELMAKNLN